MRRGNRSRLLAVGLALGATTALLLVADGCTSFDSDPAPPATEAGPDVTTLPRPDGAVDIDAADADAGSFCQRFAVAPMLCADLEDGKPASTTFPLDLGGGGMVGVVDAGYESVFAMHAAGTVPAVVGRELGAPMPEQSLAFSVRLPLTALRTVASAIIIETAGNVGVCYFGLAFSGSSAELDYASNNDAGSAVLAGHPANGDWFRVVLTLKTMNGGTVAKTVLAKVQIDGKSAVPDVTTNCSVSLFSGSHVRLQVGASAMNGPTEIFLDDIVFDGK